MTADRVAELEQRVAEVEAALVGLAQAVSRLRVGANGRLMLSHTWQVEQAVAPLVEKRRGLDRNAWRETLRNAMSTPPA